MELEPIEILASRDVKGEVSAEGVDSGSFF